MFQIECLFFKYLKIESRLPVLTVVDTEYDTTQGEPVAQKEAGRHSHSSSAFEAERTK